jgi:hypothetical protein
MTRYRSILAFCLVFLWTATPALACLPNPQMTQAEMACCKKMAGNCQMGAGHHPCCKRAVSPVAPVANIERTGFQIHINHLATLLQPMILPEARVERSALRDKLGLPPPAPPQVNSVLRI